MKILLVSPRHPWPPRRGDQIRALQFVDFLSESHEVTLLTPQAHGGDRSAAALESPAEIVSYRTSSWTRPLAVTRAALRGLPLQSGLFQQAALGHELRRRARQFDLVIVQLVRLVGHLDDLSEAPLVVDFIDSLALNLERRAQFDRPLLRPFLRLEARRLATWERSMAERARVSAVVCSRDREAMLPGLSAGAAERLRVVPLGIEARAGIDRPVAATVGAPSIVVTGNLGYFVNDDAIRWWLRDVWPLLRAARPDTRLVVAGDRPSGTLRRVVMSAGGVVLASPPSLRPILAQATVAIAPMRCGSGVPIKVLEAWAVGVPVVATSWAAAGATARAGEDLLVADTPEAWVTAVEMLLDSPARRLRLIDSGRQRLAQVHGFDRARRALVDLVAEAGAGG